MKFLANVMGFFAKYYVHYNRNIELMLIVYCILGRFYLINFIKSKIIYGILVKTNIFTVFYDINRSWLFQLCFILSLLKPLLKNHCEFILILF